MQARSESFQAAWVESLGRPLRVSSVVATPLKEGQVRVHLAYSGVCHSQLMEAQGGRGADQYLPHLLGHEATGVVEAVGSGVTKVSLGDRVILTWIKGAGCDVGGGEVKFGEQTVNAGPVTTFSEFTTVSENRVISLPNGLPMDVGVLFGCALPTGLGMVRKELSPDPGKSALIIGLGGVGLCALMGLVDAGCNPIIAVDLSSEKRALAVELGATFTVNPQEVDPVDYTLQMTGGGVDFAIDAAGRCETIQTAFACVKRQGGQCLFASHPASGDMLKIDPFELICGKQLRGSWGGSCKPDEDIPIFAQLYQEGRLPLDRLIGKIYKLNQVNEAMDDLASGRVFRPLIKMNDKEGT
jgi:S-(hydroxymethyl)glutathione dehydrogenase/alcohol dehydrogenase